MVDSKDPFLKARKGIRFPKGSTPSSAVVDEISLKKKREEALSSYRKAADAFHKSFSSEDSLALGKAKEKCDALGIHSLETQKHFRDAAGSSAREKLLSAIKKFVKNPSGHEELNDLVFARAACRNAMVPEVDIETIIKGEMGK